MMKRRVWLGLPLLAAGCGLAERPFEERRQWPLLVPRPTVLPARRGGLVLEVRTFREGPGMASRGLQELRADGSLNVAFYEEWSVPPAQGVEDALRGWLAASGRFAAVVPPGSRVSANLVLEGELTSLMAVPREGVARAALGIVVLDMRGPAPRPMLQRRMTAEAALPGKTPADAVRAELAALADVFGEIERAIAV